jgi:hypothetical protein
MQSNKNTASVDGIIASGLALEAANQNRQTQSCNDSAALQSRSTSTEAQRAKLLAMLQQKPQTTIELRDSGIMMPAARVFDLKRMGHIIESESVTQFDDNGFLHPRCARYHLIELAGIEVQP